MLTGLVNINMDHDIYKHWNTDSMLEKYSRIKSWDERFVSELYFLNKIVKLRMDILDIGCAAGGLYHGLKEKFGDINYVGIDVAANMIEKAKSLVSKEDKAEFITAQAPFTDDILGGRKFDVAIATGVFQHEPKSEELLDFMINNVKEGGYILFDLKLFHSYPTLKDINRAYCHPLPDTIYYIVFNMKDLLDLIASRQDKLDEKVEMYGYFSGMHSAVHLPSDVKEQVCSAHILLRRSDQKNDNNKKLKLDLHLPDEFMKQ